MTVYENIAFPLRLRKLAEHEIRRRVVEVAKMLGIEQLLDRYPRQLSGGQQQRVALARALVRNPRVWLMDEPLSNLDAILRVQMRAELKKLQKELRITTIYVTHDQVEAMTMADRIAVMNEGKVLQVGTPHEIYHKPRTKFVAGFIGSPPMNFLRAEVVEENGRLLLVGEGFTIEVPRELEPHLADYIGQEVEIGVRPEHVKLAPQGHGFKAVVYVTEPLGSETIINVKLGTTLLKVRVPGEHALPPGSEVNIVFDLSKIHVFNPKTGEAIV
jgi:multiple sugar transport system ATP-binding protein